MSRARRHPHRYRKTTTSFGRVWTCALPDCNHYQPRHMETLLPGKQATCNECDNIYILTHEKMLSDEPICDECETLHEMRRRALQEKANSSNEVDLDEVMKGIR